MIFEWLPNPEWLFAIATAITALTALATMRWSRRKLAAETKSVTWQHVMDKLEYLEGEIENLRVKIAEYREQLEKYRDELEQAVRTIETLEAEIRDLRGKVQTLDDFIVAQGLTPPTGLNQENP